MVICSFRAEPPLRLQWPGTICGDPEITAASIWQADFAHEGGQQLLDIGAGSPAFLLVNNPSRQMQ